MNAVRKIMVFAPVAANILLSSCFTGDAPVSDRSTIIGGKGEAAKTAEQGGKASSADTHLIRRGDTLYAIAWRYGIDFSDLAAWNKLQPPYVIYAGKRLRLVAPRGGRKPRRPDPGAVARAPDGSLVKWAWPVRNVASIRDSGDGRLLLSIPYGQAVHAAASGKVVYSGSGIRGYGNLVIVKHNNTFLSAYGNNSNLMVKEGELVESGQTIAKSGSIPGESPALYFEIRKFGKQTDTISYLPRRS